ncbi:MAG: ABC transporter permease [Eubacteriales bacterium]|jgi:putative ABC transport system permease protein
MGENIRLAFQGVWAHKMRSFLTMLGVIIGIASIIAIVSTIRGTNEQIMQNLIGAGNNNVKITLRQGEDDYYMDNGLPDGVSVVTDEQKKEIRSLDDVADASFYTWRSYAQSVTAGSHTMDTGSVCGVDEHYLSTTGLAVYSGRPFTDADFDRMNKVVLLDETAASQLFPEGGAVGSIVEIIGEPFTVIGLVKRSDSFEPSISSLQDYMTYEQSASGMLIMPLPDWPIVYMYDEPQNCVVRAKETKKMSDVGKEVEKIMQQSVTQAGTSGSDDESAAVTYKAEDLLEKAKNQQQLAASTNNLLIWIASIALLVGGIGVMNIMLVSVTERTNEIGLKKALGARKQRIMSQFLTESVVLTSLGGILGVIAGIILAEVIAKTTQTPVAISVPSIFIGVGFSMLIGVIFGILPARKAANLDPIEALRRE